MDGPAAAPALLRAGARERAQRGRLPRPGRRRLVRAARLSTSFAALAVKRVAAADRGRGAPPPQSSIPGRRRDARRGPHLRLVAGQTLRGRAAGRVPRLRPDDASRGGRELRGEPRRPAALMRSHPDLQSASIHGPTAATSRSATRPTRPSCCPSRSGAAAGWPSATTCVQRNSSLDERNQRVLITLGILAVAALAFMMLILGRGIFRPLDRLRARGEGRRGRRPQHAARLAPRRRAWSAGERVRRDGRAPRGAPAAGSRSSPTATRSPSSPNHRRFQEALAGQLDRARAGGRPFAVVLLDIDDFKRINEARGHPYGDELLARAAAGSARPCATAAWSRAWAATSSGSCCRTPTARARSRWPRRPARPSSCPRRCAARCAARPESPAIPRTPRAPARCCSSPAARWSGRRRAAAGASRRYDPEHVFVVTEEQREDFAALIARPDAVRPAFQPIVALASGEPVGYEALARFEGKPGPAAVVVVLAGPPVRARRRARGGVRPRGAGAPSRPPGTFLSINLSPSALASAQVAELLPGDLRGLVLEITEEERVLDVEGAAAPPRPAAGARRAHRGRRRRRGLRRPPAGDEHARRHHQARPRAGGGRARSTPPRSP